MDSQNGIMALIAFLSGWLVAQVIKFLLTFSRTKNVMDAISKSALTGGMPSGHTASFVAMMAFFFLEEGINSPIFALSFAIGSIVIYDSMNVRYAVGELGLAMKKVMKKGEMGEAPGVVRGHKLEEVVVGTIIGLAIGILVFYIQ